MRLSWWYLLVVLSFPSYAFSFALGDVCTLGDITFTVEAVSLEYVEIQSANDRMILGTTIVNRICTETKMKDLYLRRILWVGKL